MSSRRTLTARTADVALRCVGGAVDGYRELFVSGPVAGALSKPSPVRRTGFDRTLAVSAIHDEADDVISLTLTRPDGGRLAAWRPGAHLDLFLPSGRQRQYSLCGDPDDHDSYRVAIRRIPDGAGSVEIHDDVRVGDHLAVRGPRNAFPLAASDSYLFVAGGIGITPIRPMVRAARSAGADWRLVYLGRSRQSMPFLTELEGFGSRVDVHADDEEGPPDLARIADTAARGAAVYLCGPPPVMAGIRERIETSNRSARIHAERFSAPPVVGGRPLTVDLARSGIRVDVASDESILTAVRRVMPGVPYSCQQGFCGSCRTGVLAGRVNGAPADELLICSARGDDLVLDL